MKLVIDGFTELLLGTIAYLFHPIR